MVTKTDTRKKEMLACLEKAMGIVSVACRECGISRVTHYRWLKSPRYKAQADEISDVALDYAESKLFKNIGNGDTSAIIFYLKTKGKHRGYTERTEVVTNITLAPCIIDWTQKDPTIAPPAEN